MVATEEFLRILESIQYHFVDKNMFMDLNGEANGNPLQYSHLGNPVDGGNWTPTVYGVAQELDTTQQLKNNNKWAKNWGDYLGLSLRGQFYHMSP